MAAIDDRQGIVGTAGSGKTYGTGCEVELLLAGRRRTGIVDPLGVWWGLRLMADGKRPSNFNVVIFGGPHGDLPITPLSGALIGETVAGMEESWILDLSDLGTKAAERRFMLAFLEALYRRTRGEPLHLVFDEADMWAPQKLLDKEGEAAKLLGMMETIVRRGRVKGFIPWLITQRPAVLSKDVLSQVDGLIVFKLTSSQDRKAIGAWVEGQAEEGLWRRIYDALPAKQRGHAVVWLPAHGVLVEDAPFPTKVTFDSSATPKRGEKRRTAELKPLDVGRLKERLAKVESEAKVNDPKVLKARIAELEQAARTAGPDPAAIAAAEERGRQAAWQAAEAGLKKTAQEEFERGRALGRAEGRRDGAHATLIDAASAINELRKAGTEAADAEIAFLKRGAAPELTLKSTTRPAVPVADAPTAFVTANPAAKINEDDGLLSGPERRILDALATWRVLGHEQPSNAQAAWLARYSPSSTSYTNPRGGLKSKGLIDYPGAGRVALTGAGVALARPMDVGAGIRRLVLSQLSGPERRILEAAIAAYPEAGSNEQIAAHAGYSASSTSYTNPRGALKTKELITYPAPGMVMAAEWLFA